MPKVKLLECLLKPQFNLYLENIHATSVDPGFMQIDFNQLRNIAAKASTQRAGANESRFTSVRGFLSCYVLIDLLEAMKNARKTEGMRRAKLYLLLIMHNPIDNPQSGRCDGNVM